MLKQIQTNNAGLCLGDTVLSVCITDTKQSTGYVSQTPEPKQVQLFCMSHHPTTKENWIWVPKRWCVDRWGLCVACRQLKPWWSCECWELLWNNSWKAFSGLESDLTDDSYCISLWHLAVKLNNTQSNESPDQSNSMTSRDVAQQTQIKSWAVSKAYFHNSFIQWLITD